MHTEKEYLQAYRNRSANSFVFACLVLTVVCLIAAGAIWAAKDSQKYVHDDSDCKVIESRDFYEPDGTKRVITITICGGPQ